MTAGYVPYLLLVQTLALLAYLWRDRDASLVRTTLTCQALLLVAFPLAFGGYSIDGWRYLWRFGNSPFSLDVDRLFWISGSALDALVPTPWPLKLLSALAVALFVLALVRHLRHRGHGVVAMALFLVPVMPAYFFGFGNAVRQSLATAIALLALSGSRRWRTASFWLLVLAAWLVHWAVAAFGISALLARGFPRRALPALALAVLFGFSVHHLLLALGLDPYTVVPYASDSEGEFHYAKFALHLVLAVLIGVLALAREDEDANRFAAHYVYAVAVAALLVRYEVPFERLLLYAELLLPFVLPTLVRFERLPAAAAVLAWLAATAAALVLWSHDSLSRALGLL